MKIALAADHRGHSAKEKVAMLLSEKGHEVLASILKATIQIVTIIGVTALRGLAT